MDTAAPARVRHTARIGGAVAVIGALTTFGLSVPAHAAPLVDIQILTIDSFQGRINANTLKFAGTIEGLRAPYDGASLFLSTGDLIGASSFASATADDQPTIDVFNELGLQASAVGNREFDQGFADLTDDVIAGGTNAQWTYLGANVYHAGTTTPALPEYEIFSVAGVNVGVVGVVTQETPSVVPPGGVSALTFGDPVEAVNRVAAQLSDGDQANGESDLILAAYHEGAPLPINFLTGPIPLSDQLAASAVFAKIVNETSPEVDAILTGHSHQANVYMVPVPGDPAGTRPLIQPASYGASVGNLVFTYDFSTNEATVKTAALVPIVSTPDATLLSLYPDLVPVRDTVVNALEEADALGTEPIGSVTADITTALPNPTAPTTNTNRDNRGKESALGTLVAHAFLSSLAPPEIGGAQIALVQPSGLRDELIYAGSEAGDGDGVITFEEANAVLPFIGELVTVDLTGAQLKTVLEQQWQRDANGSIPIRPYLALGTSTGFTYTFDASLPEGSRITGMMFEGAVVEPTTTLRVGTYAFLATGGDNFRTFTQATNYRNSGLVDRDAWFAYLTANPQLSPDFRKHSISVAGLSTAPQGGDVNTVTVGSLDLTSAGSPANTTLTASFSNTADGAGAIEMGTAAVTGGGATLDVTFPVLPGVHPGYVILTAQPTGTRAVVPVTVSSPLAVVAATGESVEFGTSARIDVTVTAPSGIPAGTVSVMNASGTKLGTATLKSGRATVTLGRTALLPGTHTLTVAYEGSAGAQAATVDLVIRKASSATVAISSTLLVKKGATSKVLVVTVANGLVPVDGPVTITRSGTTVGTGTLTKGKATITIAPFASRGLQSLTVTYGGSTTVQGSSAKATVLVY